MTKHRISLCLGATPISVAPLAHFLANTTSFRIGHVHVMGDLDSLMLAAREDGVALPSGDSVTFHEAPSIEAGLEASLRLRANNEIDATITAYAEGAFSYLAEAARSRLLTPDATRDAVLLHKGKRFFALTDAPDAVHALSQPGSVAKPIKILIRYLRHTIKVDEPRLALLNVDKETGDLEKYIKPVIHAVNGIGASALEGVFDPRLFADQLNENSTSFDAIIVPNEEVASHMVDPTQTLRASINLPWPVMMLPKDATDEDYQSVIEYIGSINA